MTRFCILLLSLALIGCGTTPSPRETAQVYSDARADQRKRLDNLKYGQSMEAIQTHALSHYTPVMDFKLGSDLYYIDNFYINSYDAKNHTNLIALYKNKKLIAVTPSKEITMTWPRNVIANYTKNFNKGDEAGCDTYFKEEYFKNLVSSIEAKKVNLGKDNLVKSEAEITENIAKLSDENGKQFTARDGVELAVLSPVYVFAVPAAVAGGVVSSPLMVPVSAMHEREEFKRYANTAERMDAVRNIPLGQSIEATENLSSNIELTRPSKMKLFKTKCSASGYPLKKSEMQYDVVFFAKEEITFLRLYTPARGGW